MGSYRRGWLEREAYCTVGSYRRGWLYTWERVDWGQKKVFYRTVACRAMPVEGRTRACRGCVTKAKAEAEHLPRRESGGQDGDTSARTRGCVRTAPPRRTTLRVASPVCPYRTIVGTSLRTFVACFPRGACLCNTVAPQRAR